MTYFTSWDINVFLCLLSLGLPEDLVDIFVKKIRGIHRKFELEGLRDFHCDRGKFVDMSKWYMLHFSCAELSDKDWRKNNFNFPRAVGNLESIPVAFHNRYSALVENFRSVSEYRLSDNRIKYIELSGTLDCLYSVREEWGMDWSKDAIKWMIGFHPGRFILMDQKYINSLNPLINDHHLLCSVDHILWRVDNVESFMGWLTGLFIGQKTNKEH